MAMAWTSLKYWLSRARKFLFEVERIRKGEGGKVGAKES